MNGVAVDDEKNIRYIYNNCNYFRNLSVESMGCIKTGEIFIFKYIKCLFEFKFILIKINNPYL